MLNFIDYDQVAELYHYCASASYDHDFFMRRITPGARVLELAPDTGRISIPLIRSGAGDASREQQPPRRE